jgi:hypothetical protein
MNTTIVLRGGIYYEKQMAISAAHYSLTIQNYEGEHAVVSGAVPLGKAKWTPVPVSNASTNISWTIFNDVNNIFGRVPNPNVSSADVKFLGVFTTLEACQSAAAVEASGMNFLSFT